MFSVCSLEQEPWTSDTVSYLSLWRFSECTACTLPSTTWYPLRSDLSFVLLLLLLPCFVLTVGQFDKQTLCWMEQRQTDDHANGG